MNTKDTAFSVVIRKSDLRLHRHYTQVEAIKEAKRLAEKEKDTFFILTAVEAHKDVPKTVEVELKTLGYEPKEVAFTNRYKTVWDGERGIFKLKDITNG